MKMMNWISNIGSIRIGRKSPAMIVLFSVERSTCFFREDKTFLCWFTLAFLVMACHLPPNEIRGRVIKVIDGDTIELLQGKTKTRVRLYAIDAPERSQDFYNKSKEFLGALVAGQNVRVVQNRLDRWKRVVGDVYLSDGTHVNAQVVAEGWAWHFIRYSDDPQLALLEKRARNQRKGLWRQANPVPPWEFRKQKRQEKE